MEAEPQKICDVILALMQEQRERSVREDGLCGVGFTRVVVEAVKSEAGIVEIKKITAEHAGKLFLVRD